MSALKPTTQLCLALYHYCNLDDEERMQIAAKSVAFASEAVVAGMIGDDDPIAFVSNIVDRREKLEALWASYPDQGDLTPAHLPWERSDSEALMRSRNEEMSGEFAKKYFFLKSVQMRIQQTVKGSRPDRAMR